MFAKPFVICKEPYSKIFHICFNYLNILCVYYIYKFKPVAFSDGKMIKFQIEIVGLLKTLQLLENMFSFNRGNIKMTSKCCTVQLILLVNQGLLPDKKGN